jgi:pilus assembly protein Flp/PilA
MLGHFLRDERGATAIEYGLIAALMFLACVTAFYAFGDSATGMFSYISDHIVTATSHAGAS